MNPNTKVLWIMFLQKVVLLLLGSYLTYNVSNKFMNPQQSTTPEHVKKLNLKGLTDHEKQMAANIVVPANVTDTYADIVGLDTQIQLLNKLVVKTTKKTVNGIILHGVPGTGKTLLARATAKELQRPFINFDITTIEDKYVGESNRRLEAVFSLAKKLGKCVMFIDEADAVMSKRNYSIDQNHVNSLKTNLLQLMDGMFKNDIVFIAATNNLANIDKAFLRRLRLRVHVPLPDAAAIKSLIHKKLNYECNQEIADTCVGKQFSGSDVTQLCILAEYECDDTVTDEHLKKAMEFL